MAIYIGMNIFVFICYCILLNPFLKIFFVPFFVFKELQEMKKSE